MKEKTKKRGGKKFRVGGAFQVKGKEEKHEEGDMKNVQKEPSPHWERPLNIAKTKIPKKRKGNCEGKPQLRESWGGKRNSSLQGENHRKVKSFIH